MLAKCFLFFSGGGFITAGFLYLTQPERIFKLHAWLRDLVFNDAYVSLRHKKIGSALILLGLVLLLSAFRG